MKPQDIVFFIILVFLFHKRVSKYFVFAGIVALTVAIPLFATWVFFTAERLTWYAAAFFLIGCLLLLRDTRRVQ